MATTSTNSSDYEPARTGLFTNFFLRLMRGMENHMHIASRRHLIEELEAKTDEELAVLGIRRNDITAHVFRDMFYA